MNSCRRAVILANLGGPSKLEEVRPFLNNLFSDPDIFHFPFGKIGRDLFSSLIAMLRAPKSKKYYAAIGSKSPLHENTLNQAFKLQASLSSEGDFNVLVAQRYYHPFLCEVADRVRAESYDGIIMLPLYPQYSTTTSLSIINEWRRVSSGLPKTVYIERFYSEPGYIKACVKQIEAKLVEFSVSPHILFTAHSIPIKRILEGDPYEKEVHVNMKLIMDQLGPNYSYSLCYQSKVSPIKWLGPTVEAEIDRLVSQDVRHVLIFPISFVSEHLETLYELDIQKRNYALSHGIEQYERANTVQDRDEFIQILKKLVLEAVS